MKLETEVKCIRLFINENLTLELKLPSQLSISEFSVLTNLIGSFDRISRNFLGNIEEVKGKGVVFEKDCQEYKRFTPQFKQEILLERKEMESKGLKQINRILTTKYGLGISTIHGWRSKAHEQGKAIRRREPLPYWEMIRDYNLLLQSKPKKIVRKEIMNKYSITPEQLSDILYRNKCGRLRVEEKNEIGKVEEKNENGNEIKKQ